MYVMMHSVGAIIIRALYICTDIALNVLRLQGMNGAMAYDKHHQIHFSPTFSMFTDH